MLDPALSPFDTDEAPVELQEWAAFALLLPQLGQLTLHVVGINRANGLARISSEVIAVHTSKRHLATVSRVYNLVGPPGPADQSRAVLKALTADWKAELLGDMTRTLFDPERVRASGLVLEPRFIH